MLLKVGWFAVLFGGWVVGGLFFNQRLSFVWRVVCLKELVDGAKVDWHREYFRATSAGTLMRGVDAMYVISKLREAVDVLPDAFI